MGTSRRKFTSEFKKKVLLEALKEGSTIQELAVKYDVHPQQITDWKKHFLDNSETAFDRAGSDETKSQEKEKIIEQLYGEIAS
ncbi:MAG: transposase [Ferruginibacter sp.]